MITAKSRMTAFTIGLCDLCSGIGQKLHQVCPLYPPLRLPIWKRDAGHAAGYHNCRTLPDYHLDFDKLCTTFKKVHSLPSKFLFQLCLLKRSFCCLFFFKESVISLLLNEALRNKVFELLFFLSNLWHILHRVNNSRIHDILCVD